MKKLFAMAFPIQKGKTQQWKKFTDELKGNRYNEYAESRRKLNVHERTFFQTTPMGDFVIVTLEGPDPQTAFKNFSKGQDEFTKWFISQANEIHGIDLRNPPQGPMPELIIDSKEEVLQN